MLENHKQFGKCVGGRSGAGTGLSGARLGATLILATFGYAILAFGGVELTKGEGSFAAVWLPNAVALAMILQFRPQKPAVYLMACFAGSVSGNLAAGTNIFLSLGFSVANIAEIGFALLVFRRLNRWRLDMEVMADLLLFVAVAGCAAPFISATIAEAGLMIVGAGSVQSWFDWWMADAMGMTLVAPTLMIFVRAVREPRSILRRHWSEWVAIKLGGLVVTLLVFGQSDLPLLFLTAPILVVNAFRLGSLGTASALTKVAIIAVIFTWAGYGPITLIQRSIDAQLLVLQAFLVTGFVISLPISAAISERRGVMKTLRSRERHLALMTENVSDGVMCYNLQGICTYASPSVAHVLGAPSDSFVGLQPTDRIHEDAREAVTAIQRRLLSGESDAERFTYRRYLDAADGEPAYIEANCKLARGAADGAAEGIIVSCRDVTKRVRLEKDLVRARQHAENAAHAKSEFLANMSHEIRTPMNGVLGFSQLLLQRDLPSEVRHHIELIDESGKSMMRLLNDILDISKNEAGQTIITHEPVSLAHILSSCIKLHAANAAQKGIELTCSIDESLPETAVTDGARLRQIIHNLIGNAVKFTAQGSVTLEAAAVNGVIVIAVADTGVGIRTDRLEAIFEPFEQADKSISRRFGGTGLGLAISRQLAQLLGGTLDATSAADIGSRFVLNIPLIEPESTTQDTRLDSRAPAASAACTIPASCRILLAEDHDINRMLVTAMLERCGQQVETVHDGNAAVAAVLAAERRGEPFQLVLMDVQMPECDGYEATRMLRASGISADRLPVIALTANAFDEDVQAALASGMQAHLAKPLVYEALVSALTNWLPARAAGPLQPPSSEGSGAGNTLLQARWRERRSEAEHAVQKLVKDSELPGAKLDEIGRIVHKLAGSAGMFGEVELGARAAALDRAMQKRAAPDVRFKLAEDLLAAL